MKTFRNLLFTLVILSATDLSAQNNPGDLDPSFNGNGKVILDNGFIDLYQDLKVQPDGKIIAVGTSYNEVYASDIQVTRLLSDGTYDPDFGVNGVFNYHLGYETGAYACQIRDDGRILVAGISMDDFGGFAMIVLRLEENGILDQSFGNNGVAYYDYGTGEDIAYAMALQDDGKILLAGHIRNEDFRLVPVVVRFTENGTLDESFGLDGIATIPVTEEDNEFAAIAVQPDGKIIAAGHISNGLSWFSLLMARFDPEGALDSTFGNFGVVNMNLNNVDDEFFDLRLLDSGEILATGFTAIQGSLDYKLLLIKFDSIGNLVADFGNAGMVVWGNTSYNVGYAMEILPDDMVVVAGSSGEKPPANSDWGIWKFNGDGSLDGSFGSFGCVTTDVNGEFDEALGIAVQEDGKLVAAGKFRMENNINFGVARYLNEFNVSVPESPVPGEISIMPNPVRQHQDIILSVDFNQSQDIAIELIDITGKVHQSMVVSNLQKGSHSIKFHLNAGLNNGYYILRIYSPDGLITSKRLIIIQ